MAGALLCVLPPLLRTRAAGSAPERQAEIVRLYREQLAELERERAADAIGEAQYVEGRNEIERRLIEDVGGPDDPGQMPQRSPRWVAAAVGAGIPIVAAALYLWLGNLQALDPRALAPAESAQTVTPAQIAALVDRLAERLKQAPDDVEGWTMLARSYNLLGRFEQSAQAYARVATLVPNDPAVLADYADALAMAQGRRLAGEPYELVKRALKADPNHVKSLALAGSAEFERKNYAAAAAYWERLVPLAGAETELGRAILQSIDEAHSLGKLPARAAVNAPPGGAAKIAGADPAAITGVVRLAPGLSTRIAPGDTLFVYARAAEGARMPLAIERASAGDLPFAFRLDDSQSMTPAARLSGQARVVVGARISRSGNATPQPGDLQGSSRPVAPGARDLELMIDEVRN